MFWELFPLICKSPQIFFFLATLLLTKKVIVLQKFSLSRFCWLNIYGFIKYISVYFLQIKIQNLIIFSLLVFLFVWFVFGGGQNYFLGVYILPSEGTCLVISLECKSYDCSTYMVLFYYIFLIYWLWYYKRKIFPHHY